MVATPSNRLVPTVNGRACCENDCDSAEAGQVQTWINGAQYDVRGDVDLDGDVDADDKSLIEGDYSGLGAGRGVLSNVSNRKGFAGASSTSTSAASTTCGIECSMRRWGGG